MRQTRAASLIETLSNIGVGLTMSYIANLIVLPAFGFPVSYAQAGWMAVIFSAISIARSYAMRRVFEALRVSGVLR